jgi:hypothetical protein
MFDAAGAVMAAVGVAVTPAEWERRGTDLTRAVQGTAKRLTQSLRHSAGEPFQMEEPLRPLTSLRTTIAA